MEEQHGASSLFESIDLRTIDFAAERIVDGVP